jgi:hypothetical protein
MSLGQWFGVMGTAIAASISWSLHKSVLWATIHAGMAWIYVLYYLLTN